MLFKVSYFYFRKQKEKELNEFAQQELERSDRKGIYDDIFDMPN